MKIKLSILSILIIVAAATTAFADMGTKANRALREAVGNDGKWKVVALFGYTPLSDELISQAEAEAGTATTPRAFSALRVSQAISAQVGAQAQSNTASNVGTGTGWFKQKTGVDLEFRTIAAGNNITIESDADNVIVGTVNDGNMSSATYDPQAIAGDAFDLALHTGTIAHDSAMITGTGTYSHSIVDAHLDAIADPHGASLTQTNIGVTTGTVTTLYNTTFSGSVGTFTGTLGVGGTVTADSFIGDGSQLTGLSSGAAWPDITGNPSDNGSVSVLGGVGVGEGKIPVGSSTGKLDNSWMPGIFNTPQTFTSSNGSPTVYIIQDYVSAGTVTVNYTGDNYQYSIPTGVTQLYLECYGAKGGNSPVTNGGNGGYAAGYLNVSPQDVLHIYAGGIGGIPTGTSTAINGGGWNGGGHSTLNSGNGFYGAGGGGMSDVRLNGTSTSNIVLLAAGGGGAGHYSSASGGAGGGLTGNAGNGNNEASKGKGATQSIGGSGGTDVNYGGTGTAYSGGRGSEAGSSRGGGGGGGYYGGGGGAASNIGGAGGGGGGSSWFHALITGTSTATGSNSGNGYIVISPISTSANYPDADPLLAIKDINSAILIQLLPNGKMAVGNKFIVGTTTETFFGADIVLELNGDGYADDWLVPSFKEAKEAIIPLNAVKKQKYLDDLRNTDFVQYRYKDDIETRGGIITNDPNIAVADWMKDKKNPNLKSTSKYIDGLSIAMQALALNCEAEVGNNITKLQSLQNDIKLVMQTLRDFALTGTFTVEAIEDRLEVLETAP